MVSCRCNLSFNIVPSRLRGKLQHSSSSNLENSQVMKPMFSCPAISDAQLLLNEISRVPSDLNVSCLHMSSQLRVLRHSSSSRAAVTCEPFLSGHCMLNRAQDVLRMPQQMHDLGLERLQVASFTQLHTRVQSLHPNQATVGTTSESMLQNLNRGLPGTTE